MHDPLAAKCAATINSLCAKKPTSPQITLIALIYADQKS